MNSPISPTVTVVIPTCGRPQKLLRAVKSVLTQTYANLELVAVIDGPSPETQMRLSELKDSRVVVLSLPENVGGAEARNAGVRAARGEWVAFLDDDDEWRPDKLLIQMRVALACSSGTPIVTSRFVAKTGTTEHTWPRRLPAESEPISEYLLARNGLNRDDGFVSTITILTRKQLLLEVPFRKGLKRHQDWDWVLRAMNGENCRLLFCPEALAVCYMEDNDSVSRQPDWRYSFQWIEGLRTMVTPRAYAGFLTAHVAWQASAQKDWGACLGIFASAVLKGSPTLSDVVRYFAFWLVPPSIRRRLAELTA